MVHTEESPARHGSEEPVSKRLLQRDFLAKVEKSDDWWEALGALSNYVERPLEELEGFARDLCHCCYAEADRVAAGEGQLAIARAEVDRLKEKLRQCQLSTMKQLTAARTHHYADAEISDDLVTFHEPLQYLEQDDRELVLTIVNEKVRLLETGAAPPSLIEALVNHATGSASPVAQDATAAELAEELEDARALLQEVRRRTERAEDQATEAQLAQATAEARAREMAEEVREAKDQALAAQARLAEAEARAVQAERALYEVQGRCRELEELSAQQREEIERQQAELERQREELATKQAELERRQRELEQLQAELERERQANAAVRAELEREQQANAALRSQVKQLDQEFQALKGRYTALEKEASEMREELARRGKTVAQGTQTTLTGTKLEEQADERKRLKVMLEELQMKLKELMEACKRKGLGDSVAQIAEDLGLQAVLKEKTVFQRLYDDAMGRVQRLEKLRERVQRERKELWPGKGSPFPAAVGADGEGSPERSVLESVGDSGLPGLHSLARERDQEREQGAASPHARQAPPLSPLSETVPTPAWAVRRSQLARPERPTGAEARAGSGLLPPAGGPAALAGASPQRQMRATNSLPVLTRTQAPLPFVLVGLDGERGGRAARRRL